jgi:SNF2 family DNA or RNA helicase
MMSLANVGNFNDVGTGKTIEVIGAIHEAELQNKPILVIAPRRSLVNVWEKEFKLWSEISLLTSESPGVRKNYMRLFAEDGSEAKGAIALIADDLRLEKSYDIKDQMILGEEMAERVKSPLFACKDYRGNWYDFKSEIQRDFFQIEWGTFVIDEFHQIGLPNRKSLFSLAAGLIQAERKWPLSGTPIGGKPRRLWPILNFMYPKQYTSEWRWIDDFLEVTEEEYFIKGGHGRKRVSRSVGGIKPGTDEHFWNSHRHHMVRRTKKDALPGLPDAVEIIVDTPMTGRQLNDYIRFDEEHEIILEGGGRMTGSIVLSQYTRLRQLANSCMTFLHDERDPSKRDRTRPIATTPSNKLEYLIERLDENGIRKNDFEPGARAYVGVNDKSFLTITIDALKKAGIDCDRLDGDTKDSAPILKKFHGDQERPYVVAMTIATGGTSLDFGRANSAHALDENWDPDVMTQFFGRGDRGARETPLRCYTYRTPESIQEYVAEVAADKVLNNKTVLAIAKDIEALRRGR